MKDFELQPFPGESGVSFDKRKAYYHRVLSPRLAYGRDRLDKKLKNTSPINASEREEVNAFWHLISQPNSVTYSLISGSITYIKSAA